MAAGLKAKASGTNANKVSLVENPAIENPSQNPPAPGVL
jgi:hypothetical protein